MTFLKIEVNTEKYNIGGYDPDDSWSRDSYDGGAWVESVQLADKDGYNHWDTIEDVSVGDFVWVVLAVYSTGDSFGKDGGQCEIFLVTKNREEAYAKKEFLEQVEDYSVPWFGYFESLQEIKITGHNVE